MSHLDAANLEARGQTLSGRQLPLVLALLQLVVTPRDVSSSHTGVCTISHRLSPTICTCCFAQLSPVCNALRTNCKTTMLQHTYAAKRALLWSQQLQHNTHCQKIAHITCHQIGSCLNLSRLLPHMNHLDTSAIHPKSPARAAGPLTCTDCELLNKQHGLGRYPMLVLSRYCMLSTQCNHCQESASTAVAEAAVVQVAVPYVSISIAADASKWLPCT